MESAYKRLGGSGTASNLDEFRAIVEQASPKQVDQAWHNDVRPNLIEPLMKNGGGPLPSTNVEQVAILLERYHSIFTDSGVTSS